ncbi:MAG: protein phosphatase CheZ [Desulfobacca sp.]|nr:protein phosphatase CheZ [Desulfobacca sp.]
MADHKTSEVWLELSQGQIKLLADGIAFNIVVNPNVPALPGSENRGEKGLIQGVIKPGGQQIGVDQNYYRQISEEMYQEIGQLCKNLNLSIQNLSMAEILEANVISPGERLDQARDQLTDVMEMTEKATLNILELIEHIRDDCQEVQTVLDELSQVALPLSAAPGLATDDLEKLVNFCQSAATLLPTLTAQAEDLQAQLQAFETAQSLGPSDKPTGSKTPAPIYQFSLETILQTLYEFCTNEAVKQHLKSFMINRDSLFQVQPVVDGLNRLAQNLTPEDNFFNFPIEQIFQILAEACQDEPGVVLLKKMAATCNKIFLDAAVPLEVPPLSPSEPAPVNADQADDELSAAPPAADLTSQMAAHLERLRQLASQVGDWQSIALPSPPPDSLLDEPETILPSVPVAQEGMQRIDGALSRILEALAFQDLSGQRLLKVLKTLRGLQVQLLSFLVAYGTKIKKKEEKQELTVAESDVLAQSEIDRLITSITPATVAGEPQSQQLPEDGQPLDQAAVNDLLASLGF